MARNTTPRNTACRNASSLWLTFVTATRASTFRQFSPETSLDRLFPRQIVPRRFSSQRRVHARLHRVHFIYPFSTSFRVSTTSLKFFTDRNFFIFVLSFLFLSDRISTKDERLLQSFCKRRRDSRFIDLLQLLRSSDNRKFDEIFSRRGFRTSVESACFCIHRIRIHRSIESKISGNKRYLKIFKDEIERS